MDLFDFMPAAKLNAPLSDRMRPRSLDEFLGQKHILNQNSLLMRAIRADRLGSCIFYGPPGTGKTTLASIVAANTKGEFVKLNAVSSGVADAKKVIEQARENGRMYGKKTYLLLDECHRWSKAQSDCVLSAIEDGSIVFIGSTTENPYVSMTPAIVSRCRIFELLPLSDDDVREGITRAITNCERGLGAYNIEISPEAVNQFVWGANGDLRNALNALELAALSSPPESDGKIVIDLTVAEQSVQRKAISVDQSLYYDMLSAFCKSMRGSDPDAALYWAFRLIEAGYDPLLVFRRVLVHANEDVGLADSNALTVAVNAYLAYERLGLAEGRQALAHAIIYVCTAPKSNSVEKSMFAAIDAVRRSGDARVPHYLRDRSYPHGVDDGKEYLYPHDFGGYVKQQYLPDSLKDEVFYRPGDNGREKDIKKFMQEIANKKSTEGEHKNAEN
ncbi:MAG: replication-associated recombination protein A [Clostridia bacterium]|uniref:replication-associated recombination protein A n=1 Tax=Pumilibacter muris TaxID=2941510 RepID=UPI00203E8E3F|nr:replication-associated recombination protein A [Pumilibacter muris]MCI8595675.1 replication-associated recombination protein A [Clostridia bacterium]